MKKNKKRMLSILLACVFVFGLIPGYTLAADEENTPEVLTIQSAEDLPEFESYFQGTEAIENEALTDPSAPTSGVCGESVTWKLENGVLTISGSGAMRDYVATPWYYLNYTGEELEQIKSRYYDAPAESDLVPWYKSTASITKIVIENGITSIGNYAFDGCRNTSSLVIPDGLTRIGNAAFRYNNTLGNFEIPPSVKEIGWFAFAGCSSLTEMQIPDTVAKLEYAAFSGCYSLAKVSLPSGLEQIPALLLQGTAITEIKIPDGVKQIGNSAFSGVRLTEINLPDSVSRIGDYAFSHTALTGITIPSKVNEIGSGAFEGCQFSSVSIPDSVKKIGWYAFNSCRDLNHVRMSANIAEIQYGAFAGCENLHSIELPETILKIGNGAFGYASVYSWGRQLGDKYDDFTISGYHNTPAESYASEHGFTFVPLGTANRSGETNPFVDVNEADDFYVPVVWAYYHDPQITNGIDTTHFGPGTAVTRGQAVTFLWRAMGEPEPTETTTPFVDLKDDYYKKAVAWAVENGITNGVDSTHFDPDGELSTAHMITFLYRTINHRSDGWSEDENGLAARWANNWGYLETVRIEYSIQALCPRENVVMLLYQVIG